MNGARMRPATISRTRVHALAKKTIKYETQSPPVIGAHFLSSLGLPLRRDTDQGLLPRRYCIISPDAHQGFGAGWDHMGLRFPVGPAVMTALAVAAANILVAWILVRSVGRGIDLSALTVVILIT